MFLSVLSILTSACELMLASLQSKKEDFVQYKTRLGIVRDEKEKRKLELIGIYFVITKY